MGGYQILPVLLKEELDQLFEEGYQLDKDDFIAKIDGVQGNREALLILYDQMRNLPMRSRFPYIEPTKYDAIVASSAGVNPKLVVPDDDTLLKSFHGAWLGRCIGCALGQPVTVFQFHGRPGGSDRLCRAGIREAGPHG